MKISASVYSNKTKELEDLVKELDSFNVDYIHIDCNDDPNVFADIKRIRQISKTPIDLHIISSEPQKFADLIKEDQTEMVSFQIEQLNAPFTFPSNGKTLFGYAVTPNTEFGHLDQFPDFDFVLFTSGTPGRTGDGFSRSNFRRIREFKSRYPSKKVHADGGINDDLSFVLRNMGISLVVSGSFLVNADFIGGALHKLRNDKYSSHIPVSDFMMESDELPILPLNASVKEVLDSIENYRLGFTLLTGEDNRLEGMISNADLRRGMIKKINDLNALQVSDMLNKDPFCIDERCTVSEMLEEIKKRRFPVMFLPVIDSERRLKGALSFNNLIKGES